MGDRQARRRGEGGAAVVVTVVVATGGPAVALCRLTMASTAETTVPKM
jgi:hypothetical protein